jgi:hypothetical protein
MNREEGRGGSILPLPGCRTIGSNTPKKGATILSLGKLDNHWRGKKVTKLQELQSANLQRRQRFIRLFLPTM